MKLIFGSYLFPQMIDIFWFNLDYLYHCIRIEWSWANLVSLTIYSFQLVKQILSNCFIVICLETLWL